MKYIIINRVLRRKVHAKPLLTSAASFSASRSFLSYLSKSIFISESEDVFTNLALEDWFHRNYDFSHHHILLLWKNKNCIVVGRHQNPWLEVNFSEIKNGSLTVARRYSGGGTVYHDSENLNLTFFTPRKLYDRRHNLELIKRSLQKEWSINCEINSRDDIMHNSFKVSGTAAKLSGANAYHHCTLLVDSNKKRMSKTLHEHTKNIATNATQSTPSPIINLKELNPAVTLDRMMTVVGLEYLSTLPSLNLKKSEQYQIKAEGFRFISPEERAFPGITEKIEQLRSWQWIFGRTPKFKINMPIKVTEIASNSCSNDYIHVDVKIESGIIKNVNILVPSSFLVFTTDNMLSDISSSFNKREYSEEVLSTIRKSVIALFEEKLNDQRLVSVL